MRRMLAVVLFAGLLLSGCGVTARTVRTESGLLLHFYTMPRRLGPGDIQMGLRVQDRDYKILKLREAKCRLEGEDAESSAWQVMRPGSGRDYRIRLRFPDPGDYRLVLAGVTGQGEAFEEAFALHVPKGRSRGGVNP